MKILGIEKNFNGKLINLEKAYLDYFNNYLSIEKFASDYEVTTKQAKQIIDQGRELNHAHSKTAFSVNEILTLSYDEAINLNEESFKIWLKHNPSEIKKILKELRKGKQP